MYEQVKTPYQQKQFAKTWEYFCAKFGWENDPYAEDGIRYNLILPNKIFFRPNKVIGTVELIPYNPQNPNSTVELRFAFSKIEDIKLYQNRIWEIDKLCIHQNYQRKGYLSNLLHLIVEHAKTHQTKYYLALIEKKFYRMLKISYGSGFEQKGDELTGPTTSLVPVCADVEKLIEVYYKN